MSEVPIKHFWATPTSALDMTPLTNRIAELQAEVSTFIRERDEARRTSQYWKDEKLASESAIDTLTRERDAAREAFYTVASTYCEHLHHTKKDYHKSGEPCPVEARIKTLIQIIEGDA